MPASAAVTTSIPRDRKPRTTSPSIAHPRLLTNEGGSPQLCLRRKNLFYRGVLGSNVTVNLVAVGVVVGQGGVNLSQREMLYLSCDFFRSKAHIVPLGNTTDRNTGACNAGPAFADFRRPLD